MDTTETKQANSAGTGSGRWLEIILNALLIALIPWGMIELNDRYDTPLTALIPPGELGATGVLAGAASLAMLFAGSRGLMGMIPLMLQGAHPSQAVSLVIWEWSKGALQLLTLFNALLLVGDAPRAAGALCAWIVTAATMGLGEYLQRRTARGDG